jgi:hypothetical protein
VWHGHLDGGVGALGILGQGDRRSTGMIAIAREGVVAPNVTFEVADVFSWTTSARFDVIFFFAWLSHVPTSRFEQFWELMIGLLADRGRVLFIDEHVDEQGKEVHAPGATEMVERRSGDGSEFRIVKNFVDPEQLSARLGRLGWLCRIDRDGRDRVIGDALPVRYEHAAAKLQP